MTRREKMSEWIYTHVCLNVHYFPFSLRLFRVKIDLKKFYFFFDFTEARILWGYNYVSGWLVGDINSFSGRRSFWNGHGIAANALIGDSLVCSGVRCRRDQRQQAATLRGSGYRRRRNKRSGKEGLSKPRVEKSLPAYSLVVGTRAR